MRPEWTLNYNMVSGDIAKPNVLRLYFAKLRSVKTLIIIMKKQERETVYNKYNGMCAYCGCELEKGWHVDHINPIRRNETDYGIERINSYRATPITRGENNVSNYNPACRQCNIWKSTYSIEQFRNEVSEQINRLNSYSANYRNAKRFGLVKEIIILVVFYFEKVENQNVSQLKNECVALAGEIA